MYRQTKAELDEQHIIFLFEERCAIMEYEANMTRAQAERAAYYDLRKSLGMFTVPDVIKQKLKLRKESHNEQV